MLSTAIALLAAAIAFGQWYTARQKLILDLFEKRAERYKALRSATGVLLEKSRVDAQARGVFNRAVYDMDYLFGRDVMAHLETTQQLLLDIAATERKADAAAGTTEGLKLASDLAKMDDRFQERMKAIYPILLPYIQMEQKLPLPPWRWPSSLWNCIARAYRDRPTGE